MIGNRFHNKLNWLFSINENRSDIVTVPRYNYITSVPFQKIVLDYLTWNGIDKKGNVTTNKVYPTHTQILENKAVLARCGFSTGKYIEKLVLFVFLETNRDIPNLNPELFAYFFEENYHNSKLIKFATLETRKSNKTTKEHYDSLKRFLIEIQGFLEIGNLRTRIECNHTETPNLGNCFRCEEFITPFAKIGLNCDEKGKFTINYFINPHLKELIGESLGEILGKRFDDLARGEMKDFLKIVPLNRRYDKYFKEIQSIPNYKVSIT